MIALGGLVLSSCSGVKDFDRVHGSSLGIVGKSHQATVVSAQRTMVSADSSTKNLATVAGGVAGAGLGNVFGGGSGNTLYTVAAGIGGAVIGRSVASRAGQTYAQRLAVKVDGAKGTYTITQPIYKQFGEIQVGTRGELVESGGASYFRPHY